MKRNDPISPDTLQSIKIILTGFNLFNPGANIFYLKNGSIIPYVNMWKCVSDGINKNLNLLTKLQINSTFVKNEFVDSHDNIDFILSSQPGSKGMTYRYYTLEAPKLKLFTVVREPFERFVSGLTESIFRTFKYSGFFEKDGVTLQKTNATAIGAYINAILNYKQPLKLMGHFYPMSGVLFHYYIHTVGHLESFAKDWENMIKPSYGLTAPYRLSFGAHETSVHHPNVRGVQKNLQLCTNTLNRLKFSFCILVQRNSSNDKDPNNARQSILQLFESQKK